MGQRGEGWGRDGRGRVERRGAEQKGEGRGREGRDNPTARDAAAHGMTAVCADIKVCVTRHDVEGYVTCH